MSREEAVKIIRERDHRLDPKCVEDFCQFCGYTETEFWKIVDGLYNRELFQKNEIGGWELREPIWESC